MILTLILFTILFQIIWHYSNQSPPRNWNFCKHIRAQLQSSVLSKCLQRAVNKTCSFSFGMSNLIPFTVIYRSLLDCATVRFIQTQKVKGQRLLQFKPGNDLSQCDQLGLSHILPHKESLKVSFDTTIVEHCKCYKAICMFLKFQCLELKNSSAAMSNKTVHARVEDP